MLPTTSSPPHLIVFSNTTSYDMNYAIINKFIVSVQAFPGASGLAYTETGGTEQVVVPALNGIFKVPMNGWGK